MDSYDDDSSGSEIEEMPRSRTLLSRIMALTAHINNYRQQYRLQTLYTTAAGINLASTIANVTYGIELSSRRTFDIPDNYIIFLGQFTGIFTDERVFDVLLNNGLKEELHSPLLKHYGISVYGVFETFSVCVVLSRT